MPELSLLVPILSACLTCTALNADSSTVLPPLTSHVQVITSFCPKGGSADELALIASTTVPQAQGRPAQFQIKIPKVDGYFTGTGMACLDCWPTWAYHERLDVVESDC